VFLQALIEFAHSRLAPKLQEAAWEQRPVPYLIDLGADGTFKGIVQRVKQVFRGERARNIPEALNVPRSPIDRRSGVQPLLGVDDIRYVLGIGEWTRKNEHRNHQERHQAFIQLIGKAAEATHDPCLEACRVFYERPEEVKRAREALKHVTLSSLVALSVGEAVVTRRSVRGYWNEHYDKAFARRIEAAHLGECFICRAIAPVLSTHERIKGAASLGGQPAGVSLISFDREAFRSYGWVQNQNSPLCPKCAAAYAIAFTELLKHANQHRKDIAGVGFVFWLNQGEHFSPFDCLDQMDWDRAEEFVASGSETAHPDNVLYLFAFSTNGARLRVRWWVSQALPQVRRNLGEWFKGLRIESPRDPLEPFPFWRLLAAIHRKGVPAAQETVMLMRRAIEGRKQLLGNGILAAVLTQIRRGKLSPEQIGLVRLCINDLIYSRQKGERTMKESLDTGQISPAYLYGRLLAEYVGLEISVMKAAGKSTANTSVAERHYSLASTNPELAFPRLEVQGRMHLRTLRRKNMGSAVAVENRIRDLHLLLPNSNQYQLPSALSLEDQGRFALGFYHQRAESIARARLTQQAKSARKGNVGEQD
jgi:CRISPR-associated protein Csd1